MKPLILVGIFEMLFVLKR